MTSHPLINHLGATLIKDTVLESSARLLKTFQSEIVEIIHSIYLSDLKQQQNIKVKEVDD